MKPSLLPRGLAQLANARRPDHADKSNASHAYGIAAVLQSSIILSVPNQLLSRQISS
jgi:hypothetical protein